jgi:geranylgeranyl pyrophosphate synthase
VTSTTILPIYEPVRHDLRQVERQLRQVSAEGGFPFLAELLEHIVQFSGKQVRPAITLLASRFHPCDPAHPVLMATGVELLHIATLVHDDTVDKATTRRGRPTVSARWGREVAVLVGDYAFAKSATFVCDTGSLRVMRLFAETIMALSSGELREYVQSYDWRQTRDDYWTRIREKTASLFATAAEGGAVLSGASKPQVQALKVYGLNVGMAFQVVDDILDFEGSADVVGKPVGSDLGQGVMTLPAILLAERYPDDQAVQQVFRRRDDPQLLRGTVERIRSCGVMDQARRVAEGFCRTAREALDALPDTPERRSLIELTHYVLQRER